MFKPLLQPAELYLVFSERNTRNRGNGDYDMNRHPPRPSSTTRATAGALHSTHPLCSLDSAT